MLPLVARMTKAVSGWLAPAYGGRVEIRPDLDQVDGLSAEREALWARLNASTFLTVNEKRAAVGAATLDDLLPPGGVELRPAQTVGILGGEHLRDRPRLSTSSCPFDGSKRGRSPLACTDKSPDTPSIITRRTSWIVSPTSAMRRARTEPSGLRPSALARTHSAPARVLPAPRPPMTSHTRQGCPSAVVSGSS